MQRDWPFLNSQLELIISSVISPPFGGHNKTETGFKSRDGDTGTEDDRQVHNLNRIGPNIAMPHFPFAITIWYTLDFLALKDNKDLEAWLRGLVPQHHRPRKWLTEYLS